jgi:single-stranded-DNA-specific exonuclease
MAVGVSLAKTNLDEFRTRFADGVRAAAGGDLIEANLTISAWLTPEQIKEKLMDELETLQPFGQGNPEPVFGIRGVVLRQRPDVFKQLHFRFHFDDANGRRLFGVAWKMADRLPPTGVPLDFAVELAWNHFNDRKLLQLELVDWRPSE